MNDGYQAHTSWRNNMKSLMARCVASAASVGALVFVAGAGHKFF